MNIVVCVNQIPDPEARPVTFRFQPGAMQPQPWTGAFVMGPFDENALELALQLKDRYKARVYALSVGEKRAERSLRKALSVQADEAVWIRLDPENLDSAAVAKLLAAAIRQIPGVDLVLCGRQGGDWDSGQVGSLLAEELCFTALAFVRRIEVLGDQTGTVVREMDGDQQRVEVTVPAVLTITNEPGNQLRPARVRDIMLADRKPLSPITLAELGLNQLPQPVVEGRGLQAPHPPLRHAELLVGQTAAEQAMKLAERLLALMPKG